VEAVSLMIFESAMTQFSLTIFESAGVGVLTNPCVTFRSGFDDDFQVGAESIFLDFF
jgi:hypothetical protein